MNKAADESWEVYFLHKETPTSRRRRKTGSYFSSCVKCLNSSILDNTDETGCRLFKEVPGVIFIQKFLKITKLERRANSNNNPRAFAQSSLSALPFHCLHIRSFTAFSNNAVPLCRDQLHQTRSFSSSSESLWSHSPTIIHWKYHRLYRRLYTVHFLTSVRSKCIYRHPSSSRFLKFGSPPLNLPRRILSRRCSKSQLTLPPGWHFHFPPSLPSILPQESAYLNTSTLR